MRVIYIFLPKDELCFEAIIYLVLSTTDFIQSLLTFVPNYYGVILRCKITELKFIEELAIISISGL